MTEFSEHDPTRPLSESDRDPGLPERIGQYSIRRRIASGGMGTVYEAIQEEPRRVVAVKVMRDHTTSPEALRRFQFEAQLMARLRHPGIAQVYEAGTIDMSGVDTPFIVMEYIAGARPITEYVSEKHLGLRARLELFAQVCDAVHHGHQKGIVHRDLKPANILVDADGRVRVIDFGVARALDSDLARTADQTKAGQLVGSLPYMSPEQFDADPHNIDTRSDVYSLGVVLYQTLAGRHPHELAASKIHEIARLVREGSPRKLGEVDRELQGEVEAIVHKALARDRDLRYQSAHGLGRDIGRYLEGEAVEARPQTLRYQLEIFARRNRGILAAAVALVVVLAGGILAATTLYIRGQSAQHEAEAERAVAMAEADRAEVAVAFLKEMLTSTVPADYGVEPTMGDLLDRASERVGKVLVDQPEVEAAIRKILADAYFALLDTRSAADEAASALALYDRALGEDDPISVELAYDTRFYCSAIGRHDEEVAIATRLVEIETRQKGPAHRDALRAQLGLVSALEGAGRRAEAESMISEVIPVLEAEVGASDPLAIDARTHHAWLLLESGQDAAARAEAQRAFDLAEEADAGSVRLARSMLAAVEIVAGNFDVAARMYDREVPDEVGVKRVFQGKSDFTADGVRVLVFWETWCPFSVRTLPRFQDVYERYATSGIDVVGLTRITRNSTPEKVEEFIETTGLTFSVIEDDGRAWTWFNSGGTPFISIVRNGQVIWENVIDTPDAISGRMIRALARDG